jgi:hypothetical protein
MPAISNPDSFSWFRSDTGRYLFQSSIDVFNNNYSGLLFIKPLGNIRRIVFITETGIKIFDFEFSETGESKVHYCLEAMNRKSVINTLLKDMSLLLYNIPENSKVTVMQDKTTGKMIFRLKDNYGKRYCIINRKIQRVEELISTGAFTNKLNIKFFSTKISEPDSIILSHYNLKLKMHLINLNEN